MKFDDTIIDLGSRKEGKELIQKIWFTNTGADSLYISRVSVSDPALASQVPIGPVPPGTRASFQFSYNSSGRPGNFTRSVSVAYGNNKNDWSKRASLLVKGHIDANEGKICMDSAVANAGDIEFNDTGTVVFTLSNCSSDELDIKFDHDQYMSDLVSVSVESAHPIGRFPGLYNHNSCGPGEELYLKVKFHNIYGNAGKFERRVEFLYNHNDTLWVTIRGNYVGEPMQLSVVNKDIYTEEILEFKDSKLVKRTRQLVNGKPVSEEIFESPDNYIYKKYSLYSGGLTEEAVYKNALLSDRKVYNSSGVLTLEYFYKDGKESRQQRY